jgi:hypothetical protein
MSFFSWLRIRASTHTPRGRAQRGPAAPRFRPQLEALEDRCVPSTLKVTNPNDFGDPGSLRYEITHANSGDNIVFDSRLSNQVITLISGELVIDKSLTIKGQGETITSQYYEDGLLDVLPGSRIFEVGAGTTVAITGLTIDGGGGTRVGYGGIPGTPYDGYGGAILNFGTLTLSGCNVGAAVFVPVQYNSAQFGGAIANFGTMTVSSCFMAGNSAYGGAIGRTFVPSEGGGIYNAGTLTVSRCNMVENSANGAGGGIYNAGTAAALTVSHSTFIQNSPDAISGPYTDGGGNTVR